MKRLFTILFSAAVLISATVLVSCDGGEDSSSGGGDYYYTGDDTDDSFSGNISGGQDFVTIPSAPKNVTTKATSSSSIEVSWDAVEDADNYVVYYRPFLGIDNEKYERNGTESTKTTTSTSVSIQGLTEWEIYLFWITAKNSAGESHESDIEFNYPCSATDPDENGSESGSSDTTTTTLSAPTGLTATAASSSSIELSWNSVSGAAEYQVYSSQDSYSSSASLIGSTTSTSTTISGAKANTTYYFWVKATNGTTTSDYSSYAYATTKAASSGTTTPTLSAPTGLTATAASSSSVTLSWNSVSGATEYQIYYSEYSSSSYASFLSSKTLTSITITELEANTKYYFWVKATNGTTTSNYSSYAYATTKVASSSSSGSGGSSTVTNDLLSDMTISNTFTAPIINVTKTALTDGKNGFYISLSNSSEMNAEYYILYRSTTSKTDKSAYKKIKTVQRSSNIVFEDFDIDFTKNKTYYYIVVATSSKSDTYGTISTRGLSIVLGDVRLKYTISTDNSKQAIRRYVSVDGSDTVGTFTFAKGANKYTYDSLEPGYHSIKFCRTLNGSYMQIVSNYNFLPGCEYSISLDSGKISSSSPTLSSKSLTGFIVP